MKKLKPPSERDRNILNKLSNLDLLAHIELMIGNERKLTVDLADENKKIDEQLEKLYKLKSSSFRKRDVDFETYNRSKNFNSEKTNHEKQENTNAIADRRWSSRPQVCKWGRSKRRH